MDNNPFRTTNGIQPQQANSSFGNGGQAKSSQSILTSSISAFDPIQRTPSMAYPEQPHQQVNQYSNVLPQNNAMFVQQHNPSFPSANTNYIQQHNPTFPSANTNYIQQGMSPTAFSGGNMPFTGQSVVENTYGPNHYGQTDFGGGFMLQPQYTSQQPQYGGPQYVNQQPQQPKYRHAPVDASSLLQSRVVRCVECPVCHKNIEGDDPAINHHVNDHYS